jgi:hypothetical protein
MYDNVCWQVNSNEEDTFERGECGGEGYVDSEAGEEARGFAPVGHCGYILGLALAAR